MSTSHKDLELSLEQAAIIARAMVEVAESDGVHQREREMIEGFYRACTEAAGAADAPLGTARYDAAAARQALKGAAPTHALLKSCYMLALADGEISTAEEARIAEIAQDVGASGDVVQAAATEAKLFFLERFKGVSVFKDTARQIGRKLGLDDATLDQAL